MVAVDFQGFVVAGLGLLQPSHVQVNISHMSDRMGQPERIALRSVECKRIIVVPERGITVVKVALDLAESCECLCQVGGNAGLAAESDRLGQTALRVVISVFPSRLMGKS